MASSASFLLSRLEHPFGTTARPGLHPIPGTVPVTLEALICPPVIYYIALLFLPPAPPQAVESFAIKALRNALAILAGFLFFRLPLTYYTPDSIGLNYQLSLVGLYGGCRVLDAFFISPYLFGHIPRRVRYKHVPHAGEPMNQKPLEAEERDNDASEAQLQQQPDQTTESSISGKGRMEKNTITTTVPPSSARRDSLALATETLTRTISGPSMTPVLETATSEDGWPHSFLDRASWALELETSMRGVGFTWSTADVRHTRRTWLPTWQNRLHSIFVHVLPILVVCFAVIRGTYVCFLEGEDVDGGDGGLSAGKEGLFDEKLGLGMQLVLTAALGAFLMAAFSLAHSLAAIALAGLAPSPLGFFPPLYTTRIWDVVSVRGFWSYGWHRLFARLFLVYGVWPGEWLERKIMGECEGEPADVGKVLGGFLSSAFVHSFAVRSVLGGDWSRATGEAKFFAVNGIAVVLEEGVKRAVMGSRKRSGVPIYVWYDAPIGRIWWTVVLLFSGRQFARGWVNAGLVREMAAR